MEWKNKLFMLQKKNENWFPINHKATESTSYSKENETPNVKTQCSKNKSTLSGNDLISQK